MEIEKLSLKNVILIIEDDGEITIFKKQYNPGKGRRFNGVAYMSKDTDNKTVACFLETVRDIIFIDTKSNG